MSDIDPREFSRLEAEVKALQRRGVGLRDDVKELLELADKRARAASGSGWRLCPESAESSDDYKGVRAMNLETFGGRRPADSRLRDGD